MRHTNYIKLSLIAAVIFLGMLFFLAKTESKRLVEATRTFKGVAIENGAILYDENCKNCHGIKGEGVGQLGPDISGADFFTKRLAEVGWQGTLEEYIHSTTSYGRLMGTRQMYAGNGSTAVMPPWSQTNGGPLREDEIYSLTAYILNWQGTATGKVVFTELVLDQSNPDDPQVIERGKKLFGTSCSSCHQFRQDYSDNEWGPNLSAVKQSLSKVDPTLEVDEYLRESVLLPMAKIHPEYQNIAEKNPCGAILTETELTAIIAYLCQ